MTQHTHTPGPWIAEGWTVIADRKTRRNRAMVADCASAPMLETQWNANARLIAEAPAMLEALTEAIQFVAKWANDNDSKIGFRMVHRMESVIARVRGETD